MVVAAAAAKAQKRELAEACWRAKGARRQVEESDVDGAGESNEPGTSEERRDEVVVVPARPRPRPKLITKPVNLEEVRPL